MLGGGRILAAPVSESRPRIGVKVVEKVEMPDRTVDAAIVEGVKE